jgi:hypothetical protein
MVRPIVATCSLVPAGVDADELVRRVGDISDPGPVTLRSLGFV